MSQTHSETARKTPCVSAALPVHCVCACMWTARERLAEASKPMFFHVEKCSFTATIPSHNLPRVLVREFPPGMDTAVRRYQYIRRISFLLTHREGEPSVILIEVDLHLAASFSSLKCVT